MYEFAVVRPLRRTADFMFGSVDRKIIDGSINGGANVVQANSEVVRRAHTGKVGLYAFLMFLFSMLLIIFWMIL